MASALLFTAVFIMISGVQIISTRVLDSRRTLVIGMGMMAFFVVSIFPSVFSGVPQWAQPPLSSPLVLATLVALGLNLLFRLGIRRKVAMSVDPAALDYPRSPISFSSTRQSGGAARRRHPCRIRRATGGGGGRRLLPAGRTDRHRDRLRPVRHRRDVDLSRRPLELTGVLPTHDEILASEEGARRLAAFLIRQRSDKVQASANDGVAALGLHFRH